VITYQKLSETQEKWGIDVTVHFTDVGIDVTKTFKFVDQAQLDKDYITRMTKAVLNITDKQTRYRTGDEITEALNKIFLTVNTLSKADYETLLNTKINSRGEKHG